jgi:DNA-binding NarL/FixJ family response regulator
MITLLLVDDEPAVRQGLRMRLALEPDIQVVGEADNAAAALNEIHRVRPSVVLMDIMMPGIDGIEATSRVQECCPETAVVILTLHDRPETRERARAAGACCLVGKQEAPGTLVAAIRDAAGRRTA